MESERIHSLGATWAHLLRSRGLLGACASADYHYSQLVGKRYFKAPIDT